MNTGIFDLILFGGLAIVSGLLMLTGIVRELTPERRRRWLLGVSLGAGVMAFMLKIGLVVAFSLFPDPLLALLPERDFASSAESSPETLSSTTVGKAPYRWQALPGRAPYPDDNPPAPAKVALGKQLFFDQRLSADGTLSCASCHEVSAAKGGADGLSTAVGIGGQQGNRNVPTVLNAAFQRLLFWDGRARSLEEQAKGPLTNPVEMGMPSLQSVEDRVRGIGEYRQEFAQVFGGSSPINIENIVRAIASYERTLITPDSAYDRFVLGDQNALSAQQIRGMELFESSGCVQCHSGPNFSGASLLVDDAGFRLFPAIQGTEYETRYRLIEDADRKGAANHAGVWRIPSLRNVARTAPYFHNGAVDTLEEAVRVMARVQLGKRLSNRELDDRAIHWIGQDRKLSVASDQALNDSEVEDIVAFLKSLNGSLAAIE